MGTYCIVLCCIVKMQNGAVRKPWEAQILKDKKKKCGEVRP